MQTYTIRDPRSKAVVQFTLCDDHAQSSAYTNSLAEKDGVTARAAAKGELCEVCRQDRIRAAIRSIGSVVV